MQPVLPPSFPIVLRRVAWRRRMTPDFDEEVVFENSPLYQYLQDLGHTDFEVCSSLSPKPEKCTVTEGQQKPPARALPKRGILLKVAETIKSWILVQCSKNDDLLHKLDIGFRLDSLHTILQQEVLLQEDVELIELLDPSVLSAGQPQQQENGHLPTLCSLATPNIWDVSVLFAFISLLIMLPTWWIVSSWLLWGVILFVYLIIRALRLWRTAKLQITLKKYNVHLEDIATNSRGFTNLVRKALRLIQETEVISRGFTLVSAACPFNKAGQHPSQHLIGLRKAVYRTVRANFQAARLATLYMLKNYPLNSESDNVTNYICVVPFKELGLGLSEEQISEEEAHNLTDGFSLPALKVLFQLWVAQSSEFFRRLALLLSTANSPPGPLLTPALLPHHILSDVTQGLPHAHSACLEELKRSYEFYRYFETQHQSVVPQRLSKTQQKSRELNNVHTAVRSLQLHLKALLNEVIIFEDELEKLVCTKETQELVSEAYQILEEKLKLIQPHVQASNNCWEEAISQVDKLLRRNTDKKGKPEMACENPHCTVVPLMQPPLHIADKDPIPEEQELEAYVDDIDMDSDFRKDDFYYLSQEDRERQEREHEESKRVLQELKSVLGFKASEAERQKWKQLLFSDHAVLKSLCPVDPVEPISNSEPSVDSDMGKVCKNDTEEENNKPSTTDNEISNRTEYLCEYPLDGKNKDNSANEVFLQGAEERMYYQCESEDESQQADAGGLAPAHPTHGASLQPSIKQRLAQLQLSPDFTFTAGLAAEVAARSLSFTTMQEQTFGDEEEEQIMQENENEVEEK
ncbi:vezatin isoform X7 [Lagenorhynchus albirostris]|nr:vezatin isoform X8 [Lagenorhynchus obliquidens]XP_030712220.1 vezatin isoform X2 [Globicephala melas]XP_059881378.1 vezatin isoform X2 [Delphinus delphis]XP_060021140.1 vezatin isoform X7 [Lagenorhynchus albirostris]